MEQIQCELLTCLTQIDGLLSFVFILYHIITTASTDLVCCVVLRKMHKGTDTTFFSSLRSYPTLYQNKRLNLVGKLLLSRLKCREADTIFSVHCLYNLFILHQSVFRLLCFSMQKNDSGLLFIKSNINRDLICPHVICCFQNTP